MQMGTMRNQICTWKYLSSRGESQATDSKLKPNPKSQMISNTLKAATAAIMIHLSAGKRRSKEERSGKSIPKSMMEIGPAPSIRGFHSLVITNRGGDQYPD